jgi:GT2 family glycosyltransferase
MSDGARVTAVIVGYDSPPEEVVGLIGSLRDQTLPPIQILCVDQSVDGRFDRVLRGTDLPVEVLVLAENLGYPSACNLAARQAVGEHILFINPDAGADESCVEELARALAERPDAALAGAQVLMPDGRSVNAGDNVLHLTGLSWAGRYGQPMEDGPPRPAAVVSGAALLVRRIAFEAIGGYTEGFFMYYDDVDLAWRLRLAGWEILFCPRACIAHDYEFAKGSYKWRYLERNRWWCLLAHLELRTLVALAPLLVAVEAMIWARAVAEGWFGAKLDACRLLWASRRSLYARRREVQGRRRVGDRAIVERMSATVDSPFLASRAVRRVEPVLKAYRRVVLALAS